MKKWKNNLDEMQEQKLMKLEHNTCWLGYWLLVIAILVQLILTGSVESIKGELVVLVILCLYLVIGCLRLGIWDRHMEANWKTNLLVSPIPGVIVGVVGVITSIRNFGYYGFWTSALIFAMPFFFTTVLTFALLSLSTAIYHKRKEKLEEE